MKLGAPNALPRRAATGVANSSRLSPSSASSLSPPSASSPPHASIDRRQCRRRPVPLSFLPVASLPSRSNATQGARRRVKATAAASSETEPSPSPRRLVELVGALPADASLDERISSGEFTDAGSTKERASRPVRKFLAKDPVGPGENLVDWRGRKEEREREGVDGLPN